MFRLLALPTALLLCAVTQIAYGKEFPFGNFKIRRDINSKMSENCPDVMQVRKSGESISASDVKFDNATCEGPEWNFKNLRVSSNGENGPSSDQFLSIRTRDMKCGSFIIPTLSVVNSFRFATLTPDAISSVSGNEDINVELNPAQLKPNIAYIQIYSPPSKWCLYERTGSVEEEKTDSENECFPASATVRLGDGSVKRMHDLQIGDMVQTGSDSYSPVFAFTHRARDVISTFVEITHDASAQPLQVTPNHYVYKSDGELILAHKLAVGDAIITADGRPAAINELRNVYMRGLYNPQTIDGDIVVNNVRASTYTHAVEPNAAHALLAPLRAVFRTVSALRPLLVTTAKGN